MRLRFIRGANFSNNFATFSKLFVLLVSPLPFLSVVSADIPALRVAASSEQKKGSSHLRRNRPTNLEKSLGRAPASGDTAGQKAWVPVAIQYETF